MLVAEANSGNNSADGAIGTRKGSGPSVTRVGLRVPSEQYQR
jgi:hypothetical protein